MKNNRKMLYAAVLLAASALPGRAQTYTFTVPTRNYPFNTMSHAAGTAFGGTLSFADRNDPDKNPQNTFTDPRTLQDGTGYYVWDPLALPPVTLTITNKVTGFVGTHLNIGTLPQEALFAPTQLTIVGLDDPNRSSVSGSNTVDERAGAKTTPISGAYFFNQNGNNRIVGNVRFVEGNYSGSNDAAGGKLNTLGRIEIEGTSFVAGNQTDTVVGTLVNTQSRNALGLFNFISGIQMSRLSPSFENSITIDNKTTYLPTREALVNNIDNLAFHDYIIGGNGGRTITGGQNVSANADSGHGLMLLTSSFISEEGVSASSAAMTIRGGDFYGGGSGNSIAAIRRLVDGGKLGVSTNTLATANGGSGVLKLAGANTIEGGNFVAGHGGKVVVDADKSVGQAIGGSGIFLINGTGTSTINSSNTITVLRAGRGGEAQVGGIDALARAYGGDGLTLLNTSATLADLSATGASGGSAIAYGQGDTQAFGEGGNGVYAAYATSGTLTINGGTYSGARGGFANANTASADGGSGVRIQNGTLEVNGGTFNGAAAGSATGANAFARDGRGIFAVNSNVTVNDTLGGTTINDGIYFANSAARTLTLAGGTVNGDIDFAVADGQTATFAVSTNAAISGTVRQTGGTVIVNPTQANADRMLRKVEVDGTRMTLAGTNNFTTAEGARFKLFNTSELNFANGLTLSTNAAIQAGYGKVVAAGALEMQQGSSIALSYDGLSGMMGSVDLGTNSLAMSDPTARLFVNGIANTPTGSVQVVTGGATTFATNAANMVKSDLGWLTQTTGVDGSAGVRIDYGYNSLTNSGLRDLNPGLLAALDGVLTNSASGKFGQVNSLGSARGEKLIRYSESQLPDMVDAAFQIQQQLNNQIAARGTEFRSMNGFASTKPIFGPAPVGAAGPAENDHNLQGWIRAYGSKGSRDATGNFDSYDSTSWGTVVGVDKSFGRMLVGVAGGYGRTDLDASDTYQAKVQTYHGSIYSTLGGDSLYLDLALTYGRSESEEKSAVTDADFGSDIYSGYVGGGMRFNVKDKLAITPEASLLVSYYEQEQFKRTGVVEKVLPEYDAWSYLGSIGINWATAFQVDWLSHGFAFIPELRTHWLHEFNADLDDARFYVAGVADALPLYMRPREEDLFRLGLGLDMWNWRFRRTKFEVDYDGLFAENYAEHILSGKITVQF